MRSRLFDSVYFQGPPFRDIDIEWWDRLERHTWARERLYLNESRLYIALVNDAPSTWLHTARISRLHELIFDGVFPDFCGRFRGPDPHGIPMNVDYGNHRGTVYEDVPQELATLEDEINYMLRQLDDLVTLKSRDEFKDDIVQAAAYTHCELIRIHPFPNGNGRTSRAVIGHICARYGFLPIPLARPKAEYIDAINTWLHYKKIDHFVDFLHPLVRAQ